MSILASTPTRTRRDLGHRRLGVATARRAGLTATEVANTRPWPSSRRCASGRWSERRGTRLRPVAFCLKHSHPSLRASRSERPVTSRALALASLASNRQRRGSSGEPRPRRRPGSRAINRWPSPQRDANPQAGPRGRTPGPTAGWSPPSDPSPFPVLPRRAAHARTLGTLQAAGEPVVPHLAPGPARSQPGPAPTIARPSPITTRRRRRAMPHGVRHAEPRPCAFRLTGARCPSSITRRNGRHRSAYLVP